MLSRELLVINHDWMSKIVNVMFSNICILTTNLKSNQKLLETVVQKLLYLTPFACTHITVT